MLLQLFLSLTCCASGLAQQVISPQQQFDKIFNTPVLQQEGVNYNVIDVLQPLFEADESLKKICNSDLEYLKLFVNSQKFYNHIRWYSNSLILDANQIPVANEQQIIEEAVAWSAERG
ncbi:MAG: hypothetical protein QGF46_05405, partial [Planctomycetota bacterium]|nr:hypothetical protein [Planctomycetota bacterium]